MIVTPGYTPNAAGFDNRRRTVAIGPDGFARYIAYDYGGTYLIRCLDSYCTNYNATLAATGGDSLAIGNDGFPRIVYVDRQAVLYFIRCTDADCAGSVQNTPLLSPGAQCNTGPPDYNPLSGVYCSSGDVNEVVIGSNGLPSILFDWQNDYYQNISLSVASCGDDACATASVAEVTEVPNVDIIAGSMVVGSDGYERIVYVDQSTSAYPETGVAHYYVQGGSDTIVGNASSAWSADVAVGSDGSGSVVFSDPSWSQMELTRCDSSGCSNQSIPVQFDGSYNEFYLGVQGDGTPVVSTYGAENVDYVSCATTNCSAYSLEQMPPAVTNATIGMAIGLDGLPHFVALDNTSPFPYDYVTPTLSATVTLNSSGQVSATDGAASLYKGFVGSLNLGILAGTLGVNNGCMGGNELVGTVQPKSSLGPVTVKRTVTSLSCYEGSTVVACPQGPGDDTGTFLTTNPQDFGAKGQVYNLDTPGIFDDIATTPPTRARYNFTAYAVGPDGSTHISPDLSYYVRISCENNSSGVAQLGTDVSGDNQIGLGTTKTTWNLQ